METERGHAFAQSTSSEKIKHLDAGVVECSVIGEGRVGVFLLECVARQNIYAHPDTHNVPTLSLCHEQ